VNLKKTRFTEMFIAANGLDPDDFYGWAFSPGMLFGSPDKWWGDFGRRAFPHEGLDVCLFQDSGGQVRPLSAGTRIPLMHPGRVRALFTDFLGQAVIIEHAGLLAENANLMSVYAHTRPQAHIKPGVMVAAGEIIATIADTSASKARIRPHLHLSFGRPAPDLTWEPFVWNCMRDPHQVVLIDPLGALDGPHRVLAEAD
jgi:murein DD-endopeptidase MepM/ murein hydrolase activator NlpD